MLAGGIAGAYALKQRAIWGPPIEASPVAHRFLTGLRLGIIYHYANCRRCFPLLWPGASVETLFRPPTLSSCRSPPPIAWSVVHVFAYHRMFEAFGHSGSLLCRNSSQLPSGPRFGELPRFSDIFYSLWLIKTRLANSFFCLGFEQPFFLSRNLSCSRVVILFPLIWTHLLL